MPEVGHTRSPFVAVNVPPWRTRRTLAGSTVSSGSPTTV